MLFEPVLRHPFSDQLYGRCMKRKDKGGRVKYHAKHWKLSSRDACCFKLGKPTTDDINFQVFLLQNGEGVFFRDDKAHRSNCAVSNISSYILLLERISRSIDGPRLSGCIIARVGKVQVVVRSQYIHMWYFIRECVNTRREVGGVSIQSSSTWSRLRSCLNRLRSVFYLYTKISCLCPIAFVHQR